MYVFMNRTPSFIVVHEAERLTDTLYVCYPFPLLFLVWNRKRRKGSWAKKNESILLCSHSHLKPFFLCTSSFFLFSSSSLPRSSSSPLPLFVSFFLPCASCVWNQLLIVQLPSSSFTCTSSRTLCLPFFSRFDHKSMSLEVQTEVKGVYIKP